MWSACVVYHHPALFRQLPAGRPPRFSALFHSRTLAFLNVYMMMMIFLLDFLFYRLLSSIFHFHYRIGLSYYVLKRFPFVFKMTTQRLLMVQFEFRAHRRMRFYFLFSKQSKKKKTQSASIWSLFVQYYVSEWLHFFILIFKFFFKNKKKNLTRSQNESFALRRQVSRSSSYSSDFTSYFLSCNIVLLTVLAPKSNPILSFSSCNILRYNFFNEMCSY